MLLCKIRLFIHIFNYNQPYIIDYIDIINTINTGYVKFIITRAIT